MDEINFDDWEKIEARVAEIVKVEDVENADKLYKLEVNLGKELGKRTLLAGIKQHYDREDLEGRKIIVLVNLKPKKLKGVESQGMLLAAVNEDESKIKLLQPDDDIEVGSRVR